MGSAVFSEAESLRLESEPRVPPVRPGVIWRARLAALRPAAERSRLVLVSAPAGYGKSTLVAQWNDLDPRRSCWLQLAHGDNDPVVLLARIAAALTRVGPVDSALLEELSRPMPSLDEVVLPLLAADLSAREPFVLVLDDVDAVTAEQSREILLFFVDRVRSGSQLVLITRGEPSAGLARPATNGRSCRDRDWAARLGCGGDA
jgi:LuxR family transcriptional regulator, maltose regulon positive regulatory protein